jgi:hypothetical protein
MTIGTYKESYNSRRKQTLEVLNAHLNPGPNIQGNMCKNWNWLFKSIGHVVIYFTLELIILKNYLLLNLM